MGETLDLGTLHAKMTVDNAPYDRGIDQAQKKMAGLQRDVNGRLRDMHGRFVKDGAAMGEGLGDGIGKGRKGLHLLGRDLDVVHAKMDKVTKKFGGFRGILAGIARMSVFAGIATGAAGAASALGPVVTLVGSLVVAAGGLAAVLPAALLAGAAAAGTLAIGLQGVGDAIAGDEEALERLPGPAREFVAAVRALKPAWDSLTKSVQSKLFEGTAKTFSATASVILPRLKTGLGRVADGLSDVFKEGLKAARTPRLLAGLDDLFKSTGKSLTSASKGLSGWARGIGILLSAASPLLEDMGEYAGELGERFGEWLEEARSSGELQSTLDTMVDTLQDLVGIVGNVGGIFMSVFGAASEHGGGLLGIIETLTGKAEEFFDSAEGKTALNDFFERLNDVGAAVSPIVLAIVDAVAQLAPKIADIAEGVGPTFADLMEDLGEFIGKIDAENLADGLKSVFDAVSPLIDPLGDFVGGVTDLNGFVPVLVGALAAWTVAQWALNIAMYANPIGLIIGLIVLLIAYIVLLVLNWDKVVLGMKAGWVVLQHAFEQGKDAVAVIWSQISNWVSEKVQLVQDAIAVLARTPSKIEVWFGQAKDAAVDKLNSLVDWAKGIPGKIWDALGDLGSMLKDAGKQIIQGLIDGIQAKFGEVEDMLGSLTDKLPSWKGPESVDRVLMHGPADKIMGGLVDRIHSWFPAVRSLLGDLTAEMGLSVDAEAAPAAAPQAFTVDIGDIQLSQNVQVELDGQLLDARIVGTLNDQQRQTRRRVLAGTGTL